MKNVLFVLMLGCSGGGVYPGPGPVDASMDAYVPPSGTTTPPQPGVPSGPPRRDSGQFLDRFADAGRTPCECHFESYEAPPFVCFIQFCLGDQCINPGYQGKPKCFYRGWDPAP